MLTTKTYRSKANAKLMQDLLIGRNIIDEKKASLEKTQELVAQAVDEARNTASNVMSQLSSSARDEGILFIDYQGIILHANRAAHKVLGSEDKLIGKPIETLLAPPKHKRAHEHDMIKCSKKLYDQLQYKLTLAQVAEACKQFSFTIASATEIILNASINVPYHEGSLMMRLSLIDPMPSTLEDVTYLCKLTKP